MIIGQLKKSVIKIVVTQEKLTEYEITKTEVGNDMDIFITLIKYNTSQRCDKNKLLLVMTT